MQKYLVADFEGMEKFFRRNLINSLTGFKSLNLIGTINPNGLTNLAPFTQVFHVGASPALIGILFRPDEGSPRHTLHNILETNFFTLNHVKEEFYQKAHQTAAKYEGSEFEACGLTPEYSAQLPAPYLKEAVLKIGLKFEERVDLKINGTILIIGSILEIILPKDCVGEDGFVDLEKAGTITASGLDSYHKTIKLSRLPYPKAK